MVLGWEGNIDLELASAGSKETVCECVCLFLPSSCTKRLFFQQNNSRDTSQHPTICVSMQVYPII